MRLSAPTNKTFIVAAAALVLGIVLWGGWLGFDAPPELSFWLSAGGGLLLALGAIFNRM